MKKDIQALSIGRIIKDARKSKKLSQKELASLAGCTLAHIGRIECGLAQPSLKLLETLQAHLDTLIFDLFPFFKNAIKQQHFSKLLKHLPHLTESQLKNLADLALIMAKDNEPVSTPR